jgi:hypothetical protein
LALTQEHALIRSADDYAELFARGAAHRTGTPNTTITKINHEHDKRSNAPCASCACRASPPP